MKAFKATYDLRLVVTDEQIDNCMFQEAPRNSIRLY